MGVNTESKSQKKVHEMTAFVLAGGGTRGAAQVGMLEELTRRGIFPDRIYGASVGAINGACYASNPTADGVASLANIWRSMTGSEVFPQRRVHGPWAYFGRRESMHPNAGLRSVISRGIGYKNLEEAVIPIEVVATSLHDGEERWFAKGDAISALLASSAIPAILPPVVIDGEVLLDGGIVNNVPISRAIQAGAKRIFVLLCEPLHYLPNPPSRPYEAGLMALFLAVHARFIRELTMLPPGIEVVVFNGSGEPSVQYRDFSDTPALIDEGRIEVAKVLDHGQTKVELTLTCARPS